MDRLGIEFNIKPSLMLFQTLKEAYFDILQNRFLRNFCITRINYRNNVWKVRLYGFNSGPENTLTSSASITKSLIASR